ncbi:MAG: leucyl aminopeptidase [Myxococcales bacterium]|nr:leucyl aminopeptidase [Myxococcales bacterium]
MRVSTRSADALAFDGGLLALTRFADGEPSAAEKAIDRALDGALSAAAERMRFTGKPRQAVALDTLGKLPAARVVLLGLGERARLRPAGLRDAAAQAVNGGLSHRFTHVGFIPPDDDPATLGQLALGGQLGVYRFDDLKAEPEDGPAPRIEALTLLTKAKADDAVTRAEALANAVCLARTLTNEPANICTPERLAAVAAEIAQAPGFKLTVYGPDEIIARGMGGLRAVSSGAQVEPRFIHLAYTPPSGRTDGALAFAGKGITFDSGGLSIKPAKAMYEMYIDMGGAAAVIGAMRAVADLQPDLPVHGIVGACENAIGPDAYRPSDVLRMYNGKTVEVLNTDAEGRLVLADCLAYAAALKPRGVIDLATLTGACMVALGQFYGGLFADDEPLAAEVLAAADAADELLWRLPLDPKLADSLKSKRADLTNLGGTWGGAITAALFLQHFKGELPWVHLDIAGAVLAEKDDGHIRAGGTGFAVLTLWSLIEAAAARAS